MPVYDLSCAKCGKEWNIMASMADKMERRIPCPGCGSKKLETVYNSAPGYIIKGGGSRSGSSRTGGSSCSPSSCSSCSGCK